MEKPSNKNLFYPRRIAIASFPGGKSDRKKHRMLYSNVPERIDLLLEPFAGLANFSIVLSPRIKEIHLNDKNPEVFALLVCLEDKKKLEELIESVSEIKPITREKYYAWKGRDMATEGTVTCALRKLIILNCSVSGAGGGYSKSKAGRNWYENKQEAWLKIHGILKGKKVKISNEEYSSFLSRYNFSDLPRDTFVYLDPPYFEVAKSGALYGKDFNTVNLASLIKEVRKIKAKWIISNRDNKVTREFFREFFTLRYNGYNDMNNTQNSNPELLVSNFQLQNSFP